MHFKQMASQSLKEFFGKQSLPATADCSQSDKNIKVEPARLAEDELETAYYTRKKQHGHGRPCIYILITPMTSLHVRASLEGNRTYTWLP